MTDFNSMGKDALRKACKTVGIAYGKLNNDGMRKALAAYEFDTMHTVAEVEEKVANPLNTIPGVTEFVTEQDKPMEKAVTPPVAQVAVAAHKEAAKVRTIEKNREEQNGIKRPSAGTLCRAVWDALDKLGIDTATSKDAKALAVKKGWNANNVSIEFYQWRRFHGVTGRQAKK